MAIEDTMELTKLQGQVQAMHTQISATNNFIEALAITLLDEEDYDEACRMVAQAAGRPAPRSEEEE